MYRSLVGWGITEKNEEYDYKNDFLTFSQMNTFFPENRLSECNIQGSDLKLSSQSFVN